MLEKKSKHLNQIAKNKFLRDKYVPIKEKTKCKREAKKLDKAVKQAVNRLKEKKNKWEVKKTYI